MPLHAVSIDFWNTLVVARTGGQDRQALRLARLKAALRSVGQDDPDVDLARNWQAAVARFESCWLAERRTPPTDTFVNWIWQDLGVEMSPEQHNKTVVCFEQTLLDHPPDFADGALDAIRRLGRRFPLAIISDTMISPGRVLRELLARHGVLDAFGSFVFSDETGCAKPDTRAFATAAQELGTDTQSLIHIGDLRKTDVAGALSCGSRAILFTGVHVDTDPGPAPHAIATSWSSIENVLL